MKKLVTLLAFLALCIPCVFASTPAVVVTATDNLILAVVDERGSPMVSNDFGYLTDDSVITIRSGAQFSTAVENNRVESLSVVNLFATLSDGGAEIDRTHIMTTERYNLKFGICSSAFLINYDSSRTVTTYRSGAGIATMNSSATARKPSLTNRNNDDTNKEIDVGHDIAGFYESGAWPRSANGDWSSSSTLL